MALLQNYTLNAQNPVSMSGAAMANERSQFGHRNTINANRFMGDGDIGMNEDQPYPEQYVHPYSWGMSHSNFTISTLTASPQGVIALEVQIYPATVTIGWIPTTGTDTTLGRIEVTAKGPRVEWLGYGPTILLTGDE